MTYRHGEIYSWTRLPAAAASKFSRPPSVSLKIVVTNLLARAKHLIPRDRGLHFTNEINP